MATLAADALLTHILATIPGISYGSISGNYCTDKKATAINGILGRGKNVVTELLVPRDIVRKELRTSAAAIAELNVHKNMIGTLLAGGIRSANAHYANMLLGFYLATGQDAANIVEGSQGVTVAEDRDGDLYFSCTVPNLILGTVGNGKGLDFVEENLTRLGCREARDPGENARRLAKAHRRLSDPRSLLFRPAMTLVLHYVSAADAQDANQPGCTACIANKSQLQVVLRERPLGAGPKM